MRSRPNPIGWFLVGLLLTVSPLAEIAKAQQNAPPPTTVQESGTKPVPNGKRIARPTLSPLSELPLEQINPEFRARIQAIVDRPTIRSAGPIEAFNCKPEQYSWLLDNPQLAVRLWRALGAKVTDIESLGLGHYSYQDDQGSRVTWETVLKTNEHRVWLAEGKIKPGYFLPAVTLRAVLAIRHNEGSDLDGKTAVRHQIELAVQTDSHAVALATRLMGASAPHMAQQFVSQIEMFFGAMAWYLDQHPQRAVKLLADLEKPEINKTPPPKPASFLRPGTKG